MASLIVSSVLAILSQLAGVLVPVLTGVVINEIDGGADTRMLVLEIAAELLPVARSAVRVGQLGSLDEAFITSVSRGIVPVVRIDDRTVGAGRPGPVSVELRRRFDALVEREAVSVDTP